MPKIGDRIIITFEHEHWKGIQGIIIKGRDRGDWAIEYRPGMVIFLQEDHFRVIGVPLSPFERLVQDYIDASFKELGL